MLIHTYKLISYCTYLTLKELGRVFGNIVKIVIIGWVRPPTEREMDPITNTILNTSTNAWQEIKQSFNYCHIKSHKITYGFLETFNICAQIVPLCPWLLCTRLELCKTSLVNNPCEWKNHVLHLIKTQLFKDKTVMRELLIIIQISHLLLYNPSKLHPQVSTFNGSISNSSVSPNQPLIIFNNNEL